MQRNVRLTGRVLYKGDPGYEEARKGFNARFSIYPRVIVYCQNVQDVVHAVKWAREQGLPFRVRCGGHSYEAFSLVSDGLVIDISDMQSVSIDKARGVCVVQAGIHTQSLYEALWKKGVTVPLGTGASIGLAGLTLGGGYSLLSRKMGLTCDNLIGLEMVTATGDIIKANDTTHTDLLWACQGGGGGNFGIVTSMTFRIHPIGDVAIFNLQWNWSDLKPVLELWQTWAPEVDDRLTSALKLPGKNQGNITSSGMFIGLEKELRRLLEPLQSVRPTLKASIKSLSYIEAARQFGGIRVDQRQWAILPRVHRMKFKHSSAYAKQPFNDQAISVLIRQLENAPHTGNLVALDSYGGAINRLAADATAFPHRGSTKFNLQYQAYWADDADEARNLQWIEAFRTAMLPYASGAYQNYCDINIKDWPSAYYGNNIERLKQIKAKYDPENVFRYEQSIPPAR